MHIWKIMEQKYDNNRNIKNPNVRGNNSRGARNLDPSYSSVTESAPFNKQNYVVNSLVDSVVKNKCEPLRAYTSVQVTKDKYLYSKILNFLLDGNLNTIDSLSENFESSFDSKKDFELFLKILNFVGVVFETTQYDGKAGAMKAALAPSIGKTTLTFEDSRFTFEVIKFILTEDPSDFEWRALDVYVSLLRDYPEPLILTEDKNEKTLPALEYLSNIGVVDIKNEAASSGVVVTAELKHHKLGNEIIGMRTSYY